MLSSEPIAGLIDHTLLKADATRGDIERLTDEARRWRFASVCINPVWVPESVARLAGSGVTVATVVGFPLGANRSAVKAAEAELAVRDGAGELDMVASLGHVKSGEWEAVTRDVAVVVRAASGRLVKVIIESALLTREEIVGASRAAVEGGAGFVKTSTGFHAAGGASEAAVRLMRQTVGDAIGVKASGGIRDCTAALAMLAAGATRLGTSSGVRIVECLGDTPVGELLGAASGHAQHCRTASPASS